MKKPTLAPSVAYSSATFATAKVTAVIPDPEVANQDSSQISGASGIAIDAMGSVYAADVAPHNVRKYVKR